MITAEEARELTKQGKQDIYTKLIKALEHRIKGAAGNGNSYIYTAGLLPKEVVKYFEDAGFTVEKEKIDASLFFGSCSSSSKVHKITW